MEKGITGCSLESSPTRELRCDGLKPCLLKSFLDTKETIVPSIYFSSKYPPRFPSHLFFHSILILFCSQTRCANFARGRLYFISHPTYRRFAAERIKECGKKQREEEGATRERTRARIIPGPLASRRIFKATDFRRSDEDRDEWTAVSTRFSSSAAASSRFLTADASARRLRTFTIIFTLGGDEGRPGSS